MVEGPGTRMSPVVDRLKDEDRQEFPCLQIVAHRDSRVEVGRTPRTEERPRGHEAREDAEDN